MVNAAHPRCAVAVETSTEIFMFAVTCISHGGARIAMPGGARSRPMSAGVWLRNRLQMQPVAV